MPLTVAAIVALAGALAAWGASTLTASGGVAAWTVGVVILHETGWQGGAVLAAFFISSNLISRLGSPLAVTLDAKSERRDAWQVWANGGAAALGAMLSHRASSLGIWIVTCALAAAAADTWATSAGTRSGTTPTLVWSSRTVPAGTSGGMTPVGTGAAVAGALIVSAIGVLVTGHPLLLPVATLIGFLAMVADSTLGAFFQGRFYCPQCDAASEWRVHSCGAATNRKGGLPWLDNDGVNFLATALAACAGWASWHWLSPHP